MQKTRLTCPKRFLAALFAALLIATAPAFAFAPKALGLSGVSNARELGGIRAADGRVVRDGLLLRTGKLSKATSADIAKLKSDYSLGLIVDMRLPQECAAAPDPSIAGVKYVSLSVVQSGDCTPMTKDIFFGASRIPPDDIAGGLEFTSALATSYDMSEMYVEMLSSETAVKAYREFFELLLEAPEDRAVLWHCTSGKDRTGVASALLLAALGADRKTIMKDYLATRENTKKGLAFWLDKSRAADKGKREEYVLTTIISVNPDCMRALFKMADHRYGSVRGYLREVIGLTDDDVVRLRAKYLK